MRTLLRFISLNYLLRKGKVKTFLTIAGIAIGVAAVISIELMNRSTIIAIESLLEETAGRGELVVAGDSSGLPEELLEKVRKVKGVDHAVPVIRVSPLLTAVNGKRLLGADGKPAPRRFHVFAVDAIDEKSVPDKDFKDDDLVMEEEDKLDFAIKNNSIIITTKFANDQGIADQAGKARVTLVTSRGEKEYIVRGYLNSFGPVKIFGGAFALISSDFAQKDFGKAGRFDEINVLLEKPKSTKDKAAADKRRAGAATAKDARRERTDYSDTSTGQEELGRVRDAIQAAVGTAARVERPRDRGKQSETLLGTFQMSFSLISLVSIFVGMFLIYNTVSVSVVQRRREIGILRALGVSRGQAVSMFAIEAFLMGLVGSSLGVLLGIGLAKPLLGFSAKAVTTLIMVANIEEVHLSTAVLVAGIVIGTMAAVASALMPAMGAARVSPVEATRPTAMALVLEKRSGWYTIIGIGLLAVSGIALSIPKLRDSREIVYSSTLWIVGGFVALTPLLTVWMVRGLRPLVVRITGLMGRLAVDNLLRSPMRTSVTIGAVVTGLALVVSSATFAVSFQNSINRWIEVTIPADLVVTSSHEMISPTSLPMVPEVGDEIMRRVPAIREIQQVRMIAVEVDGKRADIITFPTAKWMKVGRLLMVEGNEKEAGKALLGGGNQVVISKNLSERWGLHLNDKIKLPTPIKGIVEFHVAGVFHDYTSVFGVISMDREVFIGYWGDNQVDSFNLYVQPGANIEKVQDDVRKVVEERYAAFVLTNRELKDKVRGFIDQAFAPVNIMVVLAMVIALLGLLNTLIVAVIERTREIAVMRTVGALARQVAAGIMIEGLLMGIVGAAIGVVAGAAMSAVNVFVVPRLQAGFQIDYNFAIYQTLIIVLVAAGTALLAAFLPAWRAAKTNLLEALEYE